MTARVGHVAIGRNEGERLVACLASLARAGGPIVYVDSGSTDGSVAAARRAGAQIVALDMSKPFTAARARNEGLKALASIAPDTSYVQFVDGDCELAEGWIDAALAFLDACPSAAAVSGRLREKYPERSLYNRLCDQEWDAPPGECDHCGGVAMMRIDRVEAVGGFKESLIAGEEPELCLRLRERGGKIFRIATDMASHDAAMTTFGQWWRRARRGGYAFAEVSHMHRASPKRIWTREALRPLFWSGLAGIGAAALFAFGPAAAPIFLIFFAKIGGDALRLRARKGLSPLTLAIFHMLAKFAEAQGVAQYWLSRWTGRRTAIIEYRASS